MRWRSARDVGCICGVIEVLARLLKGQVESERTDRVWETAVSRISRTMASVSSTGSYGQAVAMKSTVKDGGWSAQQPATRERSQLTALGARLYALEPRFRSLGLPRLRRLPLLSSRLQLCQLPCNARFDRLILLLRARFVRIHGFGVRLLSL